MHQATRRQRRIARQVARKAFIDHPNDFEAAEIAFRTNKQICSINPATVIFLIQIAWSLWKWWRSKKVSVPEEHWQADEPGFEVDDGE